VNDAGDVEALDHDRIACIGTGRRVRIHVAERPTEHQLDQLLARDVADRPGCDVLAIAQHGDAVA
jgi:hypothetical protein